MTIRKILAGAGALMMLSTHGMADENLSIDMDKGELVIEYNPDLGKKYEVSVGLPAGCEPTTKVDAVKKDDTITINHSGTPCSRGATVTLTVGKDVSALTANLKSGVLTIKKSAFKQSRKIDAVVDAGLIQSSELSIKVINNYAGQKGSYTTRVPDQSLALQVSVQAGVIKTK